MQSFSANIFKGRCEKRIESRNPRGVTNNDNNNNKTQGVNNNNN